MCILALVAVLYSYSFAATAADTGVDVLYIGDSHSYMCFGERVDQGLRELELPPEHVDHAAEKRPLRVMSIASCGSGTMSYSWGGTKEGPKTSCGLRILGSEVTAGEVCVGPKKADLASGKCAPKPATGQAPALSALLRDYRPRVTVIALGTNMLARGFDAARADIRSLIAKVLNTGSRCIWIGPPQAQTVWHLSPGHTLEMPIAAYEAFNRALSEAVTTQGCAFIDSNAKTHREQITDAMGIHYSSCPVASAWGDAVLPELGREVLRDLANPASP